MCGICGFIGFRDDNLLYRMTGLLQHRGPDRQGFYIDETVSLGHRRLSIIDISTGDQPMYNETKNIVTIYNGEIYNFHTLRKNLISQGHTFNTQCDTEVIVHNYEEKKERFVEDFNGMFAIALWDKETRTLYLIRDRLGIKPLYYTVSGTKLLFASEIKSLLEWDGIRREINIPAVNDYLTYRYVPGTDTMFKLIKKLSPGTILRYQNNKIELYPYWTIPEYKITNLSEQDCVEQYRDLLTDAVKLRLMSDVPFGAYLSGGIDSATIVGLMSGMLKEPVKTFTVGFGTETDELNPARSISRYFKTDHTEIQIQDYDLSLLPQIVWHLDDPLGDMIILPLYLLSRLAKTKVKMVLTGEGGDETLAGYIHYLIYAFAWYYRKYLPFSVRKILPTLIRNVPVNLLTRFFPYPAELDKSGRDRLFSFLTLLYSTDNLPITLPQVALFTDLEKKVLYTNKLLTEMSQPIDHTLSGQGINDFFATIFRRDLVHWLPDNILFKQDKLSMANSIEARVPFLDYRLVEFTYNLPLHLKLRGMTQKYLLRKATTGLLPPNIQNRKKQAFYIPWQKCFSSVKVTELIQTCLSEKQVKYRGYFNYNYVKQLIQYPQNKMSLTQSKQIAALIILELWHRIFIDNEKMF